MLSLQLYAISVNRRGYLVRDVATIALQQLDLGLYKCLLAHAVRLPMWFCISNTTKLALGEIVRYLYRGLGGVQ